MNYIIAIIFLLAICIPISIGLVNITIYEENEINKIIDKELKNVTTFKLKEYVTNYESKVIYNEINIEEYMYYLACKKILKQRSKNKG